MADPRRRAGFARALAQDRDPGHAAFRLRYDAFFFDHLKPQNQFATKARRLKVILRVMAL
jgi:hypothetical protein